MEDHNLDLDTIIRHITQNEKNHTIFPSTLSPQNDHLMDHFVDFKILYSKHSKAFDSKKAFEQVTRKLNSAKS